MNNPIITPILPANKISKEEIDEILDNLPLEFEKPTVILNTDAQVEIKYFQDLVSRKRIDLLFIPFQIGKAEALRIGLDHINKNRNFDYIIQFDGRSKQPVNQLSCLINELEKGSFDLIIGNRYEFQSLENQQHRLLGTNLMSLIIRELTGYELPDTVCGTRAYTKTFSKSLLTGRSHGYGFEVEQLLIARLNHLRVNSYGLKTNKQGNITNAGKLEDNLYIILSYASELKMSDNSRMWLAYILTSIKKRISFDVDLSVFSGDGFIRFEYVASGGIENAYSNQAIRDAYKVSAI